MYRIIVLEDNQTAADTLLSYIQRYAGEHNIQIQSQHFANAFDFLESYSGDADVIFFDIEMPGMTGMEAARKLRQKDANAIIVFVTNLAQYAIEGYSVNALDFILKPFTYPTMKLKFDRIFNLLAHQSKEASIKINRKGNIQIVQVHEILYVEVKNHSLVYHLSKGEVSTWNSLANASEELSGYHFALANASYLINLEHVRGIEGNNVVVGDERLPMSKGKRKSFLSELALYYGGSK